VSDETLIALARRMMDAGQTNVSDSTVTSKVKDKLCAFSEELSALLASRTASGWQGIDSAPKDGTVVDLWGRYGRLTSRKWGLETPQWFGCASSEPGWLLELSGGSWVIGETGTHWQPLPSPPAVGDR